MADPRRIIPFNRPINPLQGGKAGNKDPRNFTSGNIAGQQWDMVQSQESLAQAYAYPPPQYSQKQTDRAGADNVSRIVPTRMNYIFWLQQNTAALAVAPTPVLLVPRNLRRLDIVLMNFNANAIGYSWGPPTTNPLSGAPLGFNLPSGEHLPRVGGTVPINDLYVWGTGATDLFTAYEGIDAIEANVSPVL